MIIRFSVENHLSIRDKQELSLVASGLKDSDDGLISNVGVSDRLLPFAVIYGANASGKSNVIDGFRFLLSAMKNSHNHWKPDEGVPRQPFILDPAYLKLPSSFDLDFLQSGVRYHYGFEATDREFVAEWLEAYPGGRRQLLFRRNRQEFEFGRGLKGRNKIISELTRPNSLFISAARQNDHDELTRIFASLLECAVLTSDYLDPSAISGFRSAHMETIVRFLNKMGTGIVHYRMEEKPLPDGTKEIMDLIYLTIEKQRPGNSVLPRPEVQTIPSLELAHKSVNGDLVFLDIKRESMGTRRLLIMLAPALQVLIDGSVLFIDELDASLHTQACEAVIELFSSKVSNPKGAQLIATTHDTNFLRSPFLRRDQIWFTEKDEGGATCIYPLSDFRTRKDDNLEKGYLQGRYGAIPFSGAIDRLVDSIEGHGKE